MRRAYPTTRSNRGVTLVEMMFVMVVIGILTTIAIPRIDYARYQIDGAMRAVGTALLSAQREAIAKQHDIAVMFDVPNRSLRILLDANSNGVPEITERQRVVVLDEHVVFGRASAPARAFGPAAVNFDDQVGGLPAVIFHRNGSASDAGGLYLTSARAAAGADDGANDTRAIETVRATGRAEWFQYTGGAWRRGF